MSGVVIDGKVKQLPGGIKCTNYIDGIEPHFKFKKRTKPLQHFVLHETAGNTARGCKTTLIKKGYGVHLILDRNGDLSCHGDLKTETMIHANQLNKTSVGIEIVNPYAPSIGYKGAKYETIDAKWYTWVPDKKNKKYIVPTQTQLDIIKIIVPWLCVKLGIPYEFPTWYLNKRQRKIQNWRFRAKPRSGVVAHQDFSKHADGRYVLEYLILENSFRE